MSINLIPNHKPIFAPPVKLPIRFRRPRGLFGIDRIRDVETIPPALGFFAYAPTEFHKGIDLYGDTGEPIFAARQGEIVQISGSGDDQWIAIRHIESGGQSFTTRYLHLKSPLVAIGDEVSIGQCIGFIGDVSPAHLHFEILLIMNPTVSNDWHRINTEPIDPLPYLYPWEKIYFEQLEDVNPNTKAAAILKEVGVLRKQSIPMFQVKQNGEFYLIPLYDLDSGVQHLVTLLQDAFMAGKSVRLATRNSPFFEDIEIITGARVVG